MSGKEKKAKISRKLPGAFQTQAISQADHRQPKTDMAMPNDENVTEAHEWVNENQK